MGLDIRLPIGSMFLFVGALLTIYGAVRPLASTSVGININLTWGIVLLVFGIVMVLLGRQGSRVSKTPPASREVPARGGH
ncbi:MAG TPA: hypothetical protein VNX88_13910 [Terriglobales bacterium]|jgi:hypothetical protein|nr:hypothetical protein [Terriglobales bacterium]